MGNVFLCNFFSDKYFFSVRLCLSALLFLNCQRLDIDKEREVFCWYGDMCVMPVMSVCHACDIIVLFIVTRDPNKLTNSAFILATVSSEGPRGTSDASLRMPSSFSTASSRFLC